MSFDERGRCPRRYTSVVQCEDEVRTHARKMSENLFSNDFFLHIGCIERPLKQGSRKFPICGKRRSGGRPNLQGKFLTTSLLRRRGGRVSFDERGRCPRRYTGVIQCEDEVRIHARKMSENLFSNVFFALRHAKPSHTTRLPL